MNQFIEAEKAESARIRYFLETGDVDDSVLWHCPGVPTWANAVFHLAPAYGIEASDEHTSSSINRYTGQKAYYARVKASRGSRSQFGAGVSTDRAVAIQLALRNAIRQLTPQVNFFFYNNPAEERWENHEDFGGYNK